MLVIHSELPIRFNQQSCGSGFDEGKAGARREGSVGNHCSVRSSLTAKPVSAPSVLHNVEANSGRDCISANHIGLAIKLPFIVITDARLDTVGAAVVFQDLMQWPPGHLEIFRSYGVRTVRIGVRSSSFDPTMWRVPASHNLMWLALAGEPCIMARLKPPSVQVG